MEKITQKCAAELVRRLNTPERAEEALKAVAEATTFEMEYYDGPDDDPDSDFIGVFADGKEVAIVWG